MLKVFVAGSCLCKDFFEYPSLYACTAYPKSSDFFDLSDKGQKSEESWRKQEAACSVC